MYVDAYAQQPSAIYYGKYYTHHTNSHTQLSPLLLSTTLPIPYVQKTITIQLNSPLYFCYNVDPGCLFQKLLYSFYSTKSANLSHVCPFLGHRMLHSPYSTYTCTIFSISLLIYNCDAMVSMDFWTHTYLPHKNYIHHNFQRPSLFL